MKLIEESNTLSYEEIMEIPEMAEVYHFLENTPGPLFPKQYEAVLKDVVTEKVYTLFKENPSLPLKSVISTILSNLSDDISAKLLLKMTQLIIKQWETLSSSTNKKNRALQFA